MATEAQVLAILTGRKVFDGRQWRVYDAAGVELGDPSGALWRGVHGAMLWNAGQNGGDSSASFRGFMVNLGSFMGMR